jgi:hypothetical protein
VSRSDEQPSAPDVDRLARSMLLLHGAHDDGAHDSGAHDDGAHEDGAHDDEDHAGPRSGNGTSWSKARPDPRRAAALREATRRDRERYLSSGLQPVDCRFCHVSVLVKKLGPGHTYLQWNADATRRCAYFTEIRESGGDTARSPSCPRMADSIAHAIAEGILEPESTAPSPGDG